MGSVFSYFRGLVIVFLLNEFFEYFHVDEIFLLICLNFSVFWFACCSLPL